MPCMFMGSGSLSDLQPFWVQQTVLAGKSLSPPLGRGQSTFASYEHMHLQPHYPAPLLAYLDRGVGEGGLSYARRLVGSF